MKSILLAICFMQLAKAEDSFNNVIPQSASYFFNELGSDMDKLKTHWEDLQMSEYRVSNLMRKFTHSALLFFNNNHSSYELRLHPTGEERSINFLKFSNGEPFSYDFFSKPVQALYTVSGNIITGVETLPNGEQIKVEITVADELVMHIKSNSVALNLQFIRHGISAKEPKNHFIPTKALYLANDYGNDVEEKVKQHAKDLGISQKKLEVFLMAFDPKSHLFIKNHHPRYQIRLLGYSDELNFESRVPFTYPAFNTFSKALYTASDNKIVGKEFVTNLDGTKGTEMEMELVFNDDGESLVMTRKSENVILEISYTRSHQDWTHLGRNILRE